MTLENGFVTFRMDVGDGDGGWVGYLTRLFLTLPGPSGWSQSSSSHWFFGWWVADTLCLDWQNVSNGFSVWSRTACPASGISNHWLR